MRMSGPVWVRILAEARLLAAGLALVTGVAVPAAAQEPSVRDVLEQAAGGGDARAPAGSAGAPGPEGPGAKAEQGAGEAEIPGATPRSAVVSFMRAARSGDYATAAGFLDTRNLGKAARRATPARLAEQLFTVLSTSWWIDPDALSGDPEGRPEEGLPANREEVQRIETAGGEVPVLLQRGRTADGERIWRFAAPTVSRIPALYEEFGYGPLGDVLPRFVFEWRIAGAPLWQWIGLPALLVLAGFSGWGIGAALHLGLRRLLRARSPRALEVIESFVRGPLRLAVSAGVLSAGLVLLHLGIVMRTIAHAVVRTLLIVAFVWAFLRIVDVGTRLVRRRLVERNQLQVVPLLPAARKLTKALILLLAVLVALANLGFDVTALLAGLGIGGIAVALAAQKTVENLFGGITLFADRPIRVGDYCRFGDKAGTVEEIGLRSTQIRTLDRTLVIVPNAEFANLQLENFSARDRIWYHPTIGLRYETTPEQMRYVLVEVRRMLYAHPKVDPDPARIRFTAFGPYSLDLEIFAYVTTRDFGEYLEIAEDLNLRIMDIVARAGTGFAFPSQTLYLGRDERPPAATREEAEALVAKWRERQELYLPRFPREEVQKLEGTLDYPNEGAPVVDALGNVVRKG